MSVPGSDIVRGLAKLSGEPKLKPVIRWIIKARSEFKEKVDEIRTLITNLYNITLQLREIQLLANSLEGSVLVSVGHENLLVILSGFSTTAHQSIAHSAKAKLLQLRTS